MVLNRLFLAAVLISSLIACPPSPGPSCDAGTCTSGAGGGGDEGYAPFPGWCTATTTTTRIGGFTTLETRVYRLDTNGRPKLVTATEAALDSGTPVGEPAYVGYSYDDSLPKCAAMQPPLEPGACPRQSFSADSNGVQKSAPYQRLYDGEGRLYRIEPTQLPGYPPVTFEYAPGQIKSTLDLGCVGGTWERTFTLVGSRPSRLVAFWNCDNCPEATVTVPTCRPNSSVPRHLRDETQYMHDAKGNLLEATTVLRFDDNDSVVETRDVIYTYECWDGGAGAGGGGAGGGSGGAGAGGGGGAAGAGPPPAPLGVVATPGNGEASVGWLTSGAGPQASSYTVTSVPGGFTAQTSGATFAVVKGLTNGTAYSFKVHATNAAGSSGDSSSNTVTPLSCLRVLGLGLSWDRNPTPTVRSMATADFNADGKIDFAITDGSKLQVALGGANAIFALRPVSTGMFSTATVAAGDVDRDGKQDLLVGGGGFIGILRGNGDGTFQPVAMGPTSPLSGALFSGDWNADGKVDLAVTSGGNGTGVSIFMGNGDGTFQSPMAYGTTSTYEVAPGDFNGDARVDLAVAAGSAVIILLNNGNGTFRLSTGAAAGETSLAVGDFNGDGKLDVVSWQSNGTVNGMCASFGNGDGTFQNPVVTTPAGVSNFMSSADFDGDGKLDLPVNSYGQLEVLLGRGDGTFIERPVHANIGGAGRGVLADFDGDGKTDLAVGDRTPGDVTVLLGAGCLP